MKKRHPITTNKGKVHPSPLSTTHLLSFLPAAILTVALSLPPQDKEVLAYLISCSGNFSGSRSSDPNGGDHQPQFHCDCFRCYMSYWVRWDTSPNRLLLHEVFEAYEEGLLGQKKKLGRERVDSVEVSRNNGDVEAVIDGYYGEGLLDQKQKVKSKETRKPVDSAEADSVGILEACGEGLFGQKKKAKKGKEERRRRVDSAESDSVGVSRSGEVEVSLVGKVVRFIGERIWGVWGM